jgi:hypothetical protein
MTPFVPFSARSKLWEPLAEDLRELCPSRGGSFSFDPWPLAMELDLRVVECTLQGLDSHERLHMESLVGGHWSGGVLPTPLPDGSRICILNPAQSYRRRKITLMEEIAHCFLDHQPTSLVLKGDARFRDFNKKQEDEAFGVGAAVLMPWRSLFPMINSGRTGEEIAECYEVTPALALYRIKICGASFLYKKRQQNRPQFSVR